MGRTGVDLAGETDSIVADEMDVGIDELIHGL